MFVEATTPNTAPTVQGAIRQAARLTGASFQYLLAAAKVESNLDPSASAKTSSAGGLFQFIDQTWLGTLKQSGGALGYAKYADAIQRTDSGRFVVTDAAMRKEIMALRKDPAANAVMAGAFTQSNAQYLTQKLGRAPTDGELYMAHFLGARGAANLINLASATPNALAKDSFPRAAAANKSIFYGEGGRPRSFAEVTRALSGRYEVARASQAAPVAPVATTVPARATQAYAAASPAKTVAPAVPAAAVAAVAPIVPARAAASVAPIVPARVAAAMPAPLRVASADTTFSNPYRLRRSVSPELSIPTPVQRAAPAAAPVAPAAVAPEQATEPAQSAEPQQAAAQRQAVAATRRAEPAGEPLSLFTDMKPNVRALFTGG